MQLHVPQPTPLPTRDAMAIAPAEEKLLPFQWVKQDDENWCWIACCKIGVRPGWANRDVAVRYRHQSL